MTSTPQKNEIVEKEKKTAKNKAKKEDREKKKRERIALGKRNKAIEQTQKIMKKKKKKAAKKLEFETSSSDSEIQAPEESEDDGCDVIDEEEVEVDLPPTSKELGEFVAFSYNNNLYAGLIKSVDEDGPVISSMQSCGKLWKWPQPPDILKYSWKDVLGSINPPVKFSKTRDIFSVRELEKYFD